MAFHAAMLPGGDMDYQIASFTGLGFDTQDGGFDDDMVLATVVSFQSGDNGPSFVGAIQHADTDTENAYDDHETVAVNGPWETIEGAGAFPLPRATTKRWVRIKGAITGTGVRALVVASLIQPE